MYIYIYGKIKHVQKHQPDGHAKLIANTVSQYLSYSWWWEYDLLIPIEYQILS